MIVDTVPPAFADTVVPLLEEVRRACGTSGQFVVSLTNFFVFNIQK
jgi:hypothetical protein